MSKHSILLGLTGSEYSKNAAEVSWRIAKLLKSKVTAIHVIDSKTVWELLRFDTPGFIGSGPFVQIYDDAIGALKSLSDKLGNKYEAMAEGAGIEGILETAEGNPVEMLCKDTTSYDLIVLGHTPSALRNKKFSRYLRHSIAEGVAHESLVPVLVVQSKPETWEAMTIVSEVDHINSTYIRSCIRLAQSLGLKINLEFWGTGNREEGPESFKRDLLAEIPEAKEGNIEIEYFAGDEANERKDLFHGKSAREAASLPSETLFALPTRGVANERITVFGFEPEEFIRRLTLPCLLFWPEEHGARIVADKEKLAATQA